MWYDTKPPLLGSWRASTTLPDAPRPDISIVERDTSRLVLIDAKYRAVQDHPTNDSLTEVQYYLNAYGLDGAAIAYPSESEPIVAEAKGNKLLALGISPTEGIVGRIRSEQISLLVDLLRKPRW